MASDGDIHFPPGQRRDKPAFEPPPWEADRFEELAQRRREFEATQGEPTDGATETGADLVPPPEEANASVVEAPASSVDADGLEKPALDPKQVELLMMGLRTEEPRPDEAYWKISIIAGVITAFIGLMVTTWGMVALASPKRPGAAAIMFVAMLLIFGIGCISGGAWVVVKSLRQRGVL